MDLSFTSDQLLLRDSARRFFSAHGEFAARARVAASCDAFSQERWAQFAELGWLGLPIAEQHGGLGGGGVDTAILMTELGRVLALEPYLSTVIIAASLLSELATGPQQSLLTKIAQGHDRAVLAHGEGSFGTEVQTSARRDGDAWVISGSKRTVLDAPAANHLLVSARVDAERIAVFLVDPTMRGVRVEPFRLVDDRRAAHVYFESARLPSESLLGEARDVSAAITKALEHGIAAACAEMVGGLEVLVSDTIAYCAARVQFGQPLVRFQTVKHRLAEMTIALEEARSASLFAALHRDSSAVLRSRAASSAKAKVGRAARLIAREAVQLHGGMGVTEELRIGAYFKHALAFDTLFGTVEYHNRRIADAIRAQRFRAGEAMICSQDG